MIKFFFNIINKINDDFKEHIVKTGIIFVALATAYLLFQNIFLAFIIASAIAVFLLGWDSRFFIGFGLIFLIACPFLLAFEKKVLAEEMAVYAYYMLALGVVLQIVEYGREAVLAPKKKRGRTKAAGSKAWSRKKILILSFSAAGILIIIQSGCFYRLEKRMENKINANEKIISDLIDSRLAEVEITKAESTVAQPELTDEVFANPEISRENIKVLIKNASASAVLGEIMAEKFKELGIVNIYINNIASSSNSSTSVQYCSGCADIVTELLAALPNPGVIACEENPSLMAEIRIELGNDQIIISNGEIGIHIINGSYTVGAARKLQDEMTRQGFNIIKIGDTDKKDYQETIIKYSPGNLSKAMIVRDYLSATQNSLELSEDSGLSDNIEIILGTKNDQEIPI